MRKHKRRCHRKNNKNVRKNLIISLLMLFLLSSGYAAFNTFINISVSGTAKRTDYYVSNSGSDENGDGTLENPYLTIQKAYNEASKVANIYIMNDISQSTTVNMDKEKKITLTSYSTNNIVHSVIKTAAINGYTIRQTKGTLTIKDITLDGNNIEDAYSGIYCSNLNIESRSTLKNYVITTIDRSGGAISCFGKLSINGATVSNNASTNNGGGIYSPESCILTINNSEISNNNGAYGGGIMIAGKATIIDTVISNNRASGVGGGIRNTGNSIVELYNVTISNNEADSRGGGMSLYTNANVIINNGVISENSSNYAGAIDISCNGQKCPTLVLNRGIIKNNTSNIHGGICVTNGSSFTNNGGIICENTPSNGYETSSICPNQ